MILTKKGDKNFVVNTLSNFILEKLGLETSSVIQVIDLINFVVVKGKTNIDKVLNLEKVIDEYNEKYKKYLGDYKVVNTIDLIEYSSSLKEVTKLTLTLHNTKKGDFHYKQIEFYNNSKKTNDYNFCVKEIKSDELSYISEFPNGFSFDQGKSLYYLIKKMFYQIPSNYMMTTLTITVDETKKGDGYLDVYNNGLGNDDEVLKSAILDSFTYTKEDIINQMKKVDCNFDLLNPLKEHSYLLEGEKYLII